VPSICTRRATIDDVDVLIADVQAGFDSFVEFAPLGWVSPDVASDRDRFAEVLGHPGTWAMLALAGTDPVGHIAVTPARHRTVGRPWADSPFIPGLGHVWQLFVLPAWWGRGIASLLHVSAIEELRTRGYQTARLHTPSLNARARRFYERHGWTATGERWNEDLVLMLTEYRRPLG